MVLQDLNNKFFWEIIEKTIDFLIVLCKSLIYSFNRHNQELYIKIIEWFNVTNTSMQHIELYIFTTVWYQVIRSAKFELLTLWLQDRSSYYCTTNVPNKNNYEDIPRKVFNKIGQKLIATIDKCLKSNIKIL